MTGTFIKTIKSKLIEEMKQDIDSTGSNYYIAFGNINEWDDDSNPPSPNTSIKESYYDVYDNLLFGKKLQGTNVAYIAKTIPWVSGTVYDYYSHLDPDLYSKQFYVNVFIPGTSSSKVYKCLFNNYGGKSTTAPDDSGGDPVKYSDGYIWKYLFTVQASAASRFGTDNYFPLLPTDAEASNLSKSANTYKGSIHVTIVDNPGKKYISSNGTIGAILNDSYRKFQISDPDASTYQDAYVGSSLYIYAGSGKGKIATINDYIVNTAGKFVSTSTSLKNVSLTSKYRIGPRVIFSGDGTGATAEARVDTTTGKIVEINMVDKGSSYSYSNISFGANSNFGTSATAHPIISPPGGHGANLPAELGCEIMGVNLKTTSSDGFPDWATYRQVSLLYNPIAANNQPFSSTTFNQMRNFTLLGVRPENIMDFGEQITGFRSKATATVAYMNTTSMYVLNTVGTFQTYEAVSSTSGKTCTIAVINSPDLKPYTGQFYYYKNIEPINRSGITSEAVKLYFNF